MSKKLTKIERLKRAFLRGAKLSPAQVWNRYSIQANTFHRIKNELKTRHCWVFGKREVKPRNGGDAYNIYWLEAGK